MIKSQTLRQGFFYAPAGFALSHKHLNLSLWPSALDPRP